MKRPLEKSENNNKRRRLDNDFHPATGVHNYILNDPILDWLKLKKKKGNVLEEFNQFEESAESAGSSPAKPTRTNTRR